MVRNIPGEYQESYSSVWTAGTIEDALAELDMDNYDSDGGNDTSGKPFGSGAPGMSYYRWAVGSCKPQNWS
jgi:hypothetical protein